MNYLQNLFAGRINRRTYLIGFPLLIVLLAVIHTIIFNIVSVYHPNNKVYGIIIDTYLFIFLLAIFTYITSLVVKRLHDIGWSGWLAVPYNLLLVYGFVSAFFELSRLDTPVQIFVDAYWVCFLFLLFIAGTKKANKYGSPPKPKVDIKSILGFS